MHIKSLLYSIGLLEGIQIVIDRQDCRFMKVVTSYVDIKSRYTCNTRTIYVMMNCQLQVIDTLATKHMTTFHIVVISYKMIFRNLSKKLNVLAEFNIYWSFQFYIELVFDQNFWNTMSQSIQQIPSKAWKKRRRDTALFTHFLTFQKFF